MSTHEDRQLDFVLSVLKRLATEFRIRECDLDEDPTLNGQGDSEAGRAKLSYL